MVQQYEGDAEIIGVASRDQVPAMREFVARHELQDMVNIADVEGDVWQRFGIVAQPAWVFVDGGSQIREQVLGSLEPADLRQRLNGFER